MSKSIQVKLTLTEDEITTLTKALIVEQIQCDKRIEIGARYPDNEELTRSAEEAKIMRTKVNTLYNKLWNAHDDEKYKLLRKE